MIKIKKVVFFLLVILTIGIFLTQTHLGYLLLLGNVDGIVRYISSFGPTAIFLAFLFIMIQAFIPYIPFIILATVSVLLFGLWGGFLLSWLATSVGATLAFFTSRYLAREWAEQKVLHLPFIQKFNTYATKKGFFTILFLRLTAVVPSSMISLAAGISHINRKHFIVATFLGNLPITLAESWLGHLFIDLEKQNGEMIFILILIVFIFFLFKNRAK